MRAVLFCLLLSLLLTGCTAPALPEQTAVTSVPEPTHETQAQPTPEQCRELAEDLSRKHGLVILIGGDVQICPPWDYSLETEDSPQRILPALQQLDLWLSNYPQGMLSALSRRTGSLHVSLVRRILGKDGSDSLQTAAGIQYDTENGPFLVLVPGAGPEAALYHELFHVMEGFLSENSQALAGWEALNPPDFTYDLDYAQNRFRDGSPYLQPHTRAFIDTYSMSFPGEDRARVMEYAMLPGNQALFSAPILQAKLRILSRAIREAFSLEAPEGAFLWEQYLQPQDRYPD